MWHYDLIDADIDRLMDVVLNANMVYGDDEPATDAVREWLRKQPRSQPCGYECDINEHWTDGWFHSALPGHPLSEQPEPVDLADANEIDNRMANASTE
jgi:hypothetical protein